jgi:hypothetical protein
MARLDATTANIEDISKQIFDITHHINTGNGTLNMLGFNPCSKFESNPD